MTRPRSSSAARDVTRLHGRANFLQICRRVRQSRLRTRPHDRALLHGRPSRLRGTVASLETGLSVLPLSFLLVKQGKNGTWTPVRQSDSDGFTSVIESTN